MLMVWSLRMAVLGSLLMSAVVPAQVAPSPPAEQYAINVGDELEIFVWGEDKLKSTVKVLPDGSFSFPLVGRVVAQGRHTSDLEAVIEKGLEPMFRSQVPQVTVSVKNPMGLQFSILGKVKNPGNFTPGRNVNVLEAVSMAGGTSEFADLSNVLILRKTGSGLTPIHVRLNNALKGDPSARDLSGNGLPTLVGGDTIVVP